MIVTAGKTNVSVYFYIVQDASATSPGEPVTGLLFSDIETGGSASYARQGAARVDLTLITLASASATHADGGFILVDDTNMPGLYRCDYADATFLTGVDQVMLQIVVASGKNAVASPIFVEITDVDLRDSVRGGMTALPNAAADAAGGLPISDLGGLDLDDIPITSEFEARTIVAASYFDPAADTVANVTLTATTTNVTNQVTADMTAVSGDSTAADNLELMYDGTGYTDETGPSSRLQVDNIGAASGAALNYEASADNTSGAIIDGVTIVGSITANLFTDTAIENGTRHQLTHSGNAFDFVYKLPIGGGRTAATVEWRGFLTSSNDVCSIQAFDFGGTAWDTIATIVGTNQTNNGTVIAALLSKHTGTGSELGNVYIRFINSAQTSPVLNTDLLLVQAVNIGQSVGYANGQVWINTNASNTNTESFVDGVADNPVSTIAAGKTLSTAVGLNDFHIINGSAITLAENTDNESYFGDEWTLALGGQSCASVHFDGATVSGVATGSASSFHGGELGDVTIGDAAHVTEAGLEGTITLPAGAVAFFNCHHDGATAPILDFGAAVGSTTVHMHSYHGEIELQNFGDSGTDIIHLDGDGKLTINANSSGGTVNLRGNWEVSDSSGGAVTIVPDDLSADAEAILVDTADMQPKLGAPAADISADIAAVKVDTAAILVDTAEIGTAGAGLTDLGGMSTGMKAEVNTEADTALTDYDGPTNAEMEARTPTAAQLAYIVENAATGVPVTFTTAGGSTTVAVLALVDGGAGSATNDQYNGRLLVFTDSTLAGVVTDITDYVGSTTTATITAIPTAPTSSHNARLI